LLILLGVPPLGLFPRQIGAIFGILSRRAGLSATAGLSLLKWLSDLLCCS